LIVELQRTYQEKIMSLCKSSKIVRHRNQYKISDSFKLVLRSIALLSVTWTFACGGPDETLNEETSDAIRHGGRRSGILQRRRARQRFDLVLNSITRDLNGYSATVCNETAPASRFVVPGGFSVVLQDGFGAEQHISFPDNLAQGACIEGQTVGAECLLGDGSCTDEVTVSGQIDAGSLKESDIANNSLSVEFAAEVNECALGTDNCDANATCTNTTGSFTCLCDAGFSGDGASCFPLPIADAGADKTGNIGVPIMLDGSTSGSAVGNPLIYTWQLILSPMDSVAALSHANVVRPWFVPDVDGTYHFALVVFDDLALSTPDIIEVEVGPSTPRQLLTQLSSFAPQMTNAKDIAIQNNIAYVIGQDIVSEDRPVETLLLYDIKDVESPSFLGSIAFRPAETGGAPPRLNTVAVDGGFAVLAAGYHGMFVVDVSDPATPVEVTSYRGTGVDHYAWSVTISNGRIYLGDWQTVRVFDLSNPATPIANLSPVFATDYPHSVAVSNGYVYVLAASGVHVYQETVNGVQYVSSKICSFPQQIAFDGDKAYLTIETRLEVFDISTPGSFTPLGILTLSNPREITIGNGYAFVGDHGLGEGWLRMVSIADPNVPRLVGSAFNWYPTGNGSFRSGDLVNGLAFNNGHVFVAKGNSGPSGQGVWVVDIYDPRYPSVGPNNVGPVIGYTKISNIEGGFEGDSSSNARFGDAMAGIGDIDGDGVEDLAVGEPRVSSGFVWILLLNEDGSVKEEQCIRSFGGGFNVALAYGDNFGAAITSLGDLDSDGVPDIAVGAYGYRYNSGAVWVLFLNSNGTVKAHQKIDGSTGILSEELGGKYFFGSPLTAIGDLDGDGNTELMVGAPSTNEYGHPLANYANPNALYVLFLNEDGTVKAHQKIGSSQGGLAAQFAERDHFGNAVTPMGDLDGDGVVDVAVTAVGRNSVFTLFMNADGTVKAHQEIVGPADVRFGHSLAWLGNGRLAVGAPGKFILVTTGLEATGSVWIYSINSDGTAASTTEIGQSVGGFTGIVDGGDQFGISVASVGDLDGNGVADIAVGAIDDDDGSNMLDPFAANGGAIWILYLD
jgi:hypothetical protein